MTDAATNPAAVRAIRADITTVAADAMVITTAGDLPARHVIHAVGPRWRDGTRGEPDLLRSAYRRAFELAAENQCATVVSPSISTGIYGFPNDEAAPIAVDEATRALAQPNTPLRTITFALFSDADHATFERAIAARQADAR